MSAHVPEQGGAAKAWVRNASVYSRALGMEGHGGVEKAGVRGLSIVAIR